MAYVFGHAAMAGAGDLAPFGAGYERGIRRLCPDYDEMLSCIAEEVPDGAASVVDLGCGTGTLLGKIQRARPTVKRLVGIDLNGAHLAAARDAVPRRGGCTVDFIEADISALALPFADVYVTSLAFHELAPIAQAGLYQRLARVTPRFMHYAAVAPDGAAEEAERRAYLDWWLEEQGADAAQGRDLFARFVRGSHLLTLREHRELCASVGFSFSIVRRSPSEVVFSAWR